MSFSLLDLGSGRTIILEAKTCTIYSIKFHLLNASLR